MDHQLIIRATPDTVAEIKKILSAIDTPPENLLLEIRQQPFTQRTALNAPHQTNKVISTRSVKTPLIATYKLIEGEEFTLKKSQSPEFLLHWPIQQASESNAFALTLTVQRIGERIQLHYRLEENRNTHPKQSLVIKGVLLDHLDNWINLTSTPQHTSNNPLTRNTSIDTHSSTKKRVRRTLNATTGQPPHWQIKVRRAE